MLKKGFDRRKVDEMAKAFSEADKNKDGFLSLEEYMDVFHSHGITISRDEVRQSKKFDNENPQINW